MVVLCRRHRIERPRTNVVVHGHLVDCHWPEHRVVVELDSWRFHNTRAAFERDRERDADLQAHGFATLRFTYAQVTRRGPWVVSRLRPVLASRSRRGSSSARRSAARAAAARPRRAPAAPPGRRGPRAGSPARARRRAASRGPGTTCAARLDERLEPGQRGQVGGRRPALGDPRDLDRREVVAARRARPPTGSRSPSRRRVWPSVGCSSSSRSPIPQWPGHRQRLRRRERQRRRAARRSAPRRSRAARAAPRPARCAAAPRSTRRRPSGASGNA